MLSGLPTVSSPPSSTREMSATELTPTKRTWVISHYTLVSIFAAIAFCILAVILHRRLITGDPSDGFFAQLQFIAIALQTGTFDPATEPLHAVHLVRFGIIYPWFLTWLNGLPDIIDSLLILPLLLTVVAVKFKNRHPLINLLVFALPLAFSFRTVFVIVGLANLYACFYSDSRGQWRLYLSGLLSILSSGVALAWLVVVLANSKHITKHRPAFFTAVAIISASLVASIMQKLTYFGNKPPGASESSGLLSAIERNTIFVSYGSDNSIRFLLYCGILAVVVWFLTTLYKAGREGRPIFLFFLTAAASFVFEGLGPIAFLMPVAWVLTNNFTLPKTNPKTDPQTV